MQRWLLIPLVVFLAIAALFAFALTSDGPDLLPSQLIGKPAPKMTLAPLAELKDQGRAVPGITKASLFDTGGPVLVNFWASWCAPCIAEHPVLVSVGKQTGVPIFGINYKDKASNARRFLGQFGNPYQAVGIDDDGRAAIEWGVAKMPETFVLNGKGEIVFKHSGPLSVAVVESRILPILKALSATKPDKSE